LYEEGPRVVAAGGAHRRELRYRFVAGTTIEISQVTLGQTETRVEAYSVDRHVSPHEERAVVRLRVESVNPEGTALLKGDVSGLAPEFVEDRVRHEGVEEDTWVRFSISPRGFIGSFAYGPPSTDDRRARVASMARALLSESIVQLPGPAVGDNAVWEYARPVTWLSVNDARARVTLSAAADDDTRPGRMEAHVLDDDRLPFELATVKGGARARAEQVTGTVKAHLVVGLAGLCASREDAEIDIHGRVALDLVTHARLVEADTRWTRTTRFSCGDAP
jgi:hypothetical protein